MGYPKSSKSLEHCSIETHGDFFIDSPFQETHMYIFPKTLVNNQLS